MTRAAFLIDSGPKIGLGHLSRSLLLLAALEKRDVTCRLHTADPEAARAFDRQAEPLPAPLSALPEVDLVVCDSYRFNAPDFITLRGRCRLLAALDDTADRPLPVDVVINHNLYAPRLDYKAVSNAKVLAGPDYALVDDRVMAAARHRRAETPENAVVISFGGTDDGTRAAETAIALLPLTDARLHLIVAAGRTLSGPINAVRRKHPDRVTVHHGADVPSLLARARLYVGAAGMMSFEAFTIGIDLVVVPIVDNQRPGAAALVTYGHDMARSYDAAQLANLAARRLKKRTEVRPAPIDGNGPDRLAAALLKELAERA
jgi:spore coat polysaccharide biosynthesis predicted glycosyltransferase SpsG